FPKKTGCRPASILQKPGFQSCWHLSCGRLNDLPVPEFYLCVPDSCNGYFPVLPSRKACYTFFWEGNRFRRKKVLNQELGIHSAAIPLIRSWFAPHPCKYYPHRGALLCRP